MTLLERDWILDLLGDLERQAASRQGSIVFLGGEAGAGKSSVVQAFLARRLPESAVLSGVCDSMPTPGQLWPLHDFAQTAGPALRDPMHAGAPRELIFRGLLAELSANGGATIAVIEDAHWADDATLDLLRFLGRRIGRTRGLVIVTFRDDDTSQLQRLRLVFGDLATVPSMQRLSLPPLSRSAVAELAAGHPVDLDLLYDRTGGNAFFVTELLAAGKRTPLSIGDAVSARVARLSEHGRAAIELAAVLGESFPMRTFVAVTGGDDAGLHDAIESGTLTFQQGEIRFRHALVRDAVRNGLSSIRRAQVAGQIVDAYAQLDPPCDPAVLAHFAEEAGRFPEAARYASAAALRAADLRSYREAAAQYQRALRYSDGLTLSERSALVDKLAGVVFFCASGETDIDILRQLVESYRELGDTTAVVTHLLWLSWILFDEGLNSELLATVNEAAHLADALDDCSIRADARYALAECRRRAGDVTGALGLYAEAITLADRAGNIRTANSARVSVAVEQFIRGDEAALDTIEECIEVGKQHGIDADVSNWLTFLGFHWTDNWQLARAEQVFAEARIYTEAVELDCWRRWVDVGLSRTKFAQGDWVEAATLSALAVQVRTGCYLNRFYGYLTLGRIRARRGDPEAEEAFALARAACPEEPFPYLVTLLAAARAEAALLARDLDGARAIALAALARVTQAGYAWLAGELGHVVLATGAPLPPGLSLPEPYANEAAGNWMAAAESWQAIGAPYEAARAQAMSGQEDALRTALAVFDRLGAQPMSAFVTRGLRELGVGAIPRGPRATTRANPFGLTAREVDVLEQLGQGWTNGEIATRLFLSPRTVEHHVSAILAKLDAPTRRDAIRIARELGHQSLLMTPA